MAIHSMHLILPPALIWHGAGPRPRF
jgi:hypothetical protein